MMGDWSAEPQGRRFVRDGLTIPAVLDAQAAERPDQPLLVIDDEPLTYRQLQHGSRTAAAALAELGVGDGDRVALFMGTSPEWVTLWFGAARLGAVVVPVNTAFRGDFLARQLADSASVVVAVDAGLEERIGSVAGDVPTLHSLLVRTDGTEAPARSGQASLKRLTTDGLALDRTHDVEDRSVWDRPAAIFYTSGTTGPSKGAIATHHYLLSAAATMVDLWQLKPGEVVYAPLPLFHLSAVGSVLGPMLAGGTGVLERAFSVHATWDQVRRYGAAGMALAGAMVTMLWNLPPDERDRDVPLRFLSAAPVPGELYRAVQERWGCRIVTCYGLSEAFPLTVAGVDDDNPPGASGRPNPDFDVAVVDTDDRAVAAGQTGEIVCRPRRPHVMFEGYDGRPQETLAQMQNLWFHTGDLGRMDGHGNLTYVDRKKDAMRRRGENISSFEVEQALLRSPDVAEVAAIGCPSDLGEDDVMVCLVAKDPTAFDVVAFMDFCCEKLPYFAVPRYVDVVDELPKNAVGRVLKHELRARGVSASVWDREEAGYVVRR
jgi:crotonobetaine/carnitine-CoA ligase